MEGGNWGDGEADDVAEVEEGKTGVQILIVVSAEHVANCLPRKVSGSARKAKSDTMRARTLYRARRGLGSGTASAPGTAFSVAGR